MNEEQQKHIDFLFASDKFKSQKNQDRWVLLEVLPLMKNGYFLDLAAADGMTHNNTYVLEKHFGWSGLCIEPNPVYYCQLLEHRNCDTSPSVVSHRQEMLPFRVDNGQLGGIVADDTDNNANIRGQELPNATIISLPAKTLNQILIEHQAPAIIDYFSLDVEGSEERIISTLDFDAYQFGCITIERPTLKVNEILFDQGYRFVKNFKNDSFYVHPRILEQSNLVCQEFEQVPKKDW